MFLHSGASLHGHEYSNKTSQPAAGQVAARRNHLLRSTFTSPVNRPSTRSYNSDSPFPPPPPRAISSVSAAAGAPSPSILRVHGRPISRRAPSTPEPVVRFQEPAADQPPPPPPPPVHRASTVSYKPDSSFPPPLPPRPVSSTATHTITTPPSLTNNKGRPLLSRRVTSTPEPAVKFHEPVAEHVLRAGCRDEAMSGDEGSVYISDSETSRAGSSVRCSNRMSSRSSTSYLLAQPAPKLNQRLLHIRPQLLLQTQQISADRRTKPTVDVYPSSAIAHSALVKPLFKRFPRLARIKRELSVGDIMLVKSEDFSTPTKEALDEDDEDSINKRDLVAILSPLGRDMAEIVLSDGTVWTAKPRICGSAISYDFTTEDEHGNSITARWARRKDTSKPSSTAIPASPTAPVSSTDHRFTFSMIDPSCRRHPIMATLKPNHLEVQDTYTTVSQSAGRYPPTSSLLGSPSSMGPEEMALPERTVRTVEEWQKTLIQVTALWVVLHHGWVPQFRPMNIESLPTTGTNNPPKVTQQTRSFSFGSGSPGQTRGNPLHRITRRVGTTGQCCEVEPGTNLLGALPRRATSTGAAYMQKRNAQNRLSMESPSSEDSEQRPGQSPLGGDWNGSGSLTNRSCEGPPSSLARPRRPNLTHDFSYPPPPGATLAPEPLPTHRRVVSEYYYSTPWRVSSPLSMEEDQDPFEHASFKQSIVVDSGLEDGGSELRPRTPRRRSMLNWFTRLRGQ
ncbi:endonuclease/Exonuclease/phosphatase [Apiospora arundinis]